MLHRRQLTKCLKHLLHLLKRSVIQLMVATIWFHFLSPFSVMHSLIFLLKLIERARPLRVAQTDRTVKHQRNFEIVYGNDLPVVINNAAHEWLGVWHSAAFIHVNQDLFIYYETLPRANADKNERRSNSGTLHVNNMGIYMTRSSNSDIFTSNQKQVGKAKATPFSYLLAHHKTYHAMLL